MRHPRADSAPEASPSASSADSDASDSHAAPDPPLTFEDVLPVPLAEFLDGTWNERVVTWTVPDDALRRLRAGFCGGDTSAVVRRCRDEHNRAYDASDAADFAARFDAGDTLNLPFCHTRGASQLKNDILRRAYNAADDEDDPLGCANDVEVGVYVSPENGAEARWHHDNNHNVTVQLWGVKEWRTSPSGNPNVLTSRGLDDPPNTAYDVHALHPPNLMNHRVTRLAPGQAIYVPPGEWHRVIPIETDPTVGSCFSVDARVASVTHARWTCEALFASMTCGGGCGAFVGSPPTRAAEDTRGDCERLGFRPHPLHAREPTPSSALRGANRGSGARNAQETRRRARVGVEEHLRACERVVRRMLDDFGDDRGDRGDRGEAGSAKRDARFPRTWFPPRAMPFEDALTDGMDLGATLGFLVDEIDGGSLPDVFERELRLSAGRSFTVVPHAMVAMTTHPIEDEESAEDGDEEGDAEKAEKAEEGDEDGDAEKAENASSEKAENASSEKAENASSAFSDGFLLRLRATSNLTNMDYARFTIACPPGIDPGVVRALTRGADEPRVATTVPDFGATRDLLNVLSHARFVWLVEGPEPRDDRGDDRTRKRARV